MTEVLESHCEPICKDNLSSLLVKIKILRVSFVTSQTCYLAVNEPCYFQVGFPGLMR